MENNDYELVALAQENNEDAINRINMLKGITDIDSSTFTNFDYAVCSLNWYIYSLNGTIYSDILSGGDVIGFQNTKEMINIKKNI